ncbi:hypothetical protein HPB52_000275 [Rhipicephalus sanguineus]|uniref:Uncharacterized protein n=1 Tax=Rhipicephalus sanguineus TaxID=34632 RepID=A0A9D4PT15_RHISA|nr:hypothetical protein HPB52_000275 [Rhipicephalus sanguineus]
MRRSVGAEATCLGLMKRDVDNVSFFLNTLGQLHTLGVKFDPSPLYPPVPLPVPRGTPNIGHLVSWDHSQQWTVAKWNDFPMLAQETFQTADLCERQNLLSVFICTQSQARKAPRFGAKGIGPGRTQPNVRYLSEEHLKASQYVLNKGATKSGVNFGNTRRE